MCRDESEGSVSVPDPRHWYLRVCPCGSSVTTAGTPCAGFPGAWNDEKADFDRSACLGEVVEVVEVVPSG